MCILNMEFSFEVVQTSTSDVNVKRFHLCPLCWVCRPTSGYMIETMYIYYIVIEIYIFVCTNIFSFCNFLCVTIMSYHFPTMYFTQS
jgi:hypothetical protein